LLFLALFFFPVAVYCLVLGMLNRRTNPVMVSGPWDFLGVLLAASGLILFGGPAALTMFYDKEVRDFLVGRYHDFGTHFSSLFYKWWGIWALYYLLVLGCAGFLVWLRRGKTAVYNIEPAALDETLARVLERLDLEWARLGNRVFIGFPGGSIPSAGIPVPQDPHVVAGLPPKRPGAVSAWPDREAIVDVEPFYATRHVTLSWVYATGPVRHQVEAELGRSLNEVFVRDNPASTWLMLVASFLFALIFFGVALMIVMEIRMRHNQF
jgi:hypothetical protein